MKSTLLLLIILATVLSTLPLHPLEIEKEFQLRFDAEVSFFLVDGGLVVWDDSKMEFLYYKDGTLAKTTKVNRGQGPGDFRIVINLLNTSDGYMVWDRYSRRFTAFSRDWKLGAIKKMPGIGFGLPLGFVKDRVAIQWNAFSKKSTGRGITQHAGVLEGEKKISFHAVPGPLTRGTHHSLNRPFLVSALDGDMLYYAETDKYTVYRINAAGKKPAAQTYIKREWKSQKWPEALSELQWDVHKKPVDPPKLDCPAYIPPLFCLSARDGRLAVATNERIMEKRTVIDIFENGRLAGSVDIPLLFMQYTVFPNWLYFSPGLEIDKDHLYTLHCDEEEGDFSVVRWKIK